MPGKEKKAHPFFTSKHPSQARAKRNNPEHNNQLPNLEDRAMGRMMAGTHEGQAWDLYRTLLVSETPLFLRGRFIPRLGRREKGSNGVIESLGI